MFLIDEKTNQACNYFKSDVTASEVNACKNCHLHRKSHVAVGSTMNSLNERSKFKAFSKNLKEKLTKKNENLKKQKSY